MMSSNPIRPPYQGTTSAYKCQYREKHLMKEGNTLCPKCCRIYFQAPSFTAIKRANPSSAADIPYAADCIFNAGVHQTSGKICDGLSR